MNARSLMPVLLALLAGCGKEPPTGPGPLLEQLPRALTPAEVRLIEAGNQFTFDLFREATGHLAPGSNAFLSPFSASMALGMTLNGAAGATFDSMRATLRLGQASQDEINQGYRDLLDLARNLDRTTEWQVANAVWIDEGLPVRAEFLDATRTWFDAEAATLDLQSPAALGTINGWVKEKTRERIPTLLEQISGDEVMFLVNALYFKGRWRLPFDPARTRAAPFHGADGRTSSVQMMWLDEAIRYAERPGFQAADLLYGNGAFTMTVLLPREGETPKSILAGLSPESWKELETSFQSSRIQLGLPRFRLEFRRDLVDDLTALGMGIAFAPTRADFSGIAQVQPERLYLTTVLQKAFVDVNEEGTEAAAATAVGVGVTSAPPSMVVDRPFLFVIRERLSGTILFLGVVNSLP